MSRDKARLPADTDILPKPYSSVGAGNLAAFLWKSPEAISGSLYEFNFFRVTKHGEVSQLLVPGDLLHLIKLVQALAIVITDDGGLPLLEQTRLSQLADDLDELLRSIAARQSSTNCSHGTARHQK